MKATKTAQAIKTQQVNEIAALFGGFASKETDAESVARSWSRWEKRLGRLAETACSDPYRYQEADAEFERLRKMLPARFAKLFRHCRKFERVFFITSDPRGYCLKINRKHLQINWAKSRVQTDWGGDIILSPEA